MRRIGWFDDARPGHRQQIHALLQAIAERVPVSCHALHPISTGQSLRCFLRRRSPDNWPETLDLLVGCGHRSHAGLLAGQYGFGLSTVVLMRPSLPLRLFQHAIIPEHDRPPQADRVFASRGALAPAIAPGQTRGDTLVLLGGPSRHGFWDSAQLISRTLELIASDPQRRWVVSDSPRSPRGILTQLRQTVPGGLQVRFNSVAEQPQDWLAGQLQRSHTVWLTPDSASMVYQALSAGCAVGLLPLQRPRRSRVRDGLERLVADGLVLDWQQHLAGLAPVVAREPLREAERAADWLVQRLEWQT